MKLSKYVVLLAGLVGLGAFFLPLMTVNVKDLGGKVYLDESYSGLDMVRGIQDAKQGMREVGEAGSAVGGEIGEAAADLRDNADSIGNLGLVAVAIPFAPSLLFVGLFFVALLSRYGRLLACAAVLTAGVSIATAVMASKLSGGSSDTIVFQGSAWALLAASTIIGLFAGIAGLVKPEPAKERPTALDKMRSANDRVSSMRGALRHLPV